MINLQFTIEQANLVLASLNKAQAEINQLILEIQNQASEQLPQAPTPSNEEQIGRAHV